MIPDKKYLQVLEHGKNLGRKEVVDELTTRLEQLQHTKGIGVKTFEKICQVLEIKLKTGGK